MTRISLLAALIVGLAAFSSAPGQPAKVDPKAPKVDPKGPKVDPKGPKVDPKAPAPKVDPKAPAPKTDPKAPAPKGTDPKGKAPAPKADEPKHIADLRALGFDLVSGDDGDRLGCLEDRRICLGGRGALACEIALHRAIGALHCAATGTRRDGLLLRRLPLHGRVSRRTPLHLAPPGRCGS